MFSDSNNVFIALANLFVLTFPCLLPEKSARSCCCKRVLRIISKRA